MIEIGTLVFGLFCLYQAVRLRSRVSQVYAQKREQVSLRASNAVKDTRMELCIIGGGYVAMAVSLRLFGDHSSSQELYYIAFGVVMLLLHIGSVLWVFGRGSFAAYARQIYADSAPKAVV